MSLQKRNVPILVNGGLDTKTNPKLIQPPGLLELENLEEQRTGELRVREGFNTLPGSFGLTNVGTIYADPKGGMGAINRGFSGNPYANAAKYSAGWLSGWRPLGLPSQKMGFPVFKAEIFPVTTSDTEGGTIGAGSFTQVDPDVTVANGICAISWLDSNSGGAQVMTTYDIAAGKQLNWSRAYVGTAARPPVCASTGNRYFGLFGVNNAAPGSITVQVVDTTVTSAGTSATPVVADVAAAQPWMDCRGIPGSSNFALAYRATGGGVTVIVFSAVSRTVIVGPVNIAGADASFTLGWLDNTNDTSSLYLATVGSASGAVVRRLNPATLGTTATNVIDATATANVRNVTGHVVTGANDYIVLWDVANATTIYDKTMRGAWTGAAAVSEIAGSLSLYSRSFLASDGLWYFVAAYDSGVQPCYFMWPVNQNGNQGVFPQCQVVQGEGGGRRTVQCSLTSVATESTGRYSFGFLRKKSIDTPGGSAAAQAKIVQRASLVDSFSSLFRPRELGGTVFMPGGQLFRDDGATAEPATFLIYPEAGTGVPSGGGAMTASSSYSYRTVLRRVDATGRIQRSAGSVPWTVSTGVGQGTVTLTLPNPRIPIAETIAPMVEVYRAGPAASGATTYNKVGEVAANTFAITAPGNTLTFVDTMSDTNAALGEVAYFSGNTIENFAPPSHSLLEVCSGRVWVVNAENPTELWYSKEYKPGVGVGFSADLTLRLDGDGQGPVVALAEMDGRLIAFKAASIWVISGEGPNDLGQGSFSAPQCISRSVGCSSPGSVVSTPDGIMFQSSKGGIWLLDRGLGTTYVGAPVELYTLTSIVTGAPVVDASLVRKNTQVRFVQASGRCLAWDYFLKRWSTYLLPVGASAIVACANTGLFDWCYALANGTVMQGGGTFTDDGVTIVPRISLPHLNLAGLAGYQRLYKLVFILGVTGDCTVSVDAEYDYSGAVTGFPRTKALTAGTTALVEWNPGEGLAKTTAVRPVLTISGAALLGSFRLTSVTAVVGVKRGVGTVAGDRMT